ncbi:hypothetical protein W02_04460 [Nitrospira sp. KM1]|uniref:DUF1501 domain-containing protein n=1 Tax=Nitrospira sp. KM1 TaxID=1936990 RepID=UPI0013A724ED|nr:DUF1501 domain-containing protein [Nitrospira sp. KM1]BCA53306.1 hypothetical protein W02_04460 [Nitrospira sp. KM1]
MAFHLKRDLPEPLPVSVDEPEPSCSCCGESLALLSRRTFLRRVAGSAGAAMLLNLFPGAFFFGDTARAASNSGKTLVVVFLRGGNDGLNTIVPYSDPEYYTMRPLATNGGIGILPPGSGNGSGLDLPGTGFAMHPSIQPLLNLYTNGTLAIVTRAGYLGSTQSHFTDQDTIERGVYSLQDGWLNRYLRAVAAAGPSNLRAASFGSQVAGSMRGQLLVPAIYNLRSLSFARLNAAKASLQTNLRAMYGQDPALTSTNPFRTLVHQLGPDMLNRIGELEAIGAVSPQNGAIYPNTGFGSQMKDLAHIIRSGLGLEVATIDIGGWDTHEDQGGGGTFALNQGARLADLSGSIRAFYDDLGPLMNKVVIVTCTEFGRTVRQNASKGTDHAKATVWFLLGGSVKGGLYHGAAGWPAALTPANLDQGRYIAATVEFRDIFSDILTNHFGASSSELTAVLPGHVHTPVGLFA